MIEVKLDSATAIHYFRPHSIGVLANQKAGESDDGLFIDEKCVFGRPPAGKFHELAIVVNVQIEIEFVKTDFGLDLAVHESQAGRGLDKFIEGRRRAHDDLPARSPNTPLGLHEFKNFLRTIDTWRQLQNLALGNADPKKQIQDHDENRGNS